MTIRPMREARTKQVTLAGPCVRATIALLVGALPDQHEKVMLLATDGEPNCRPASLDPSTPDVDGTTAALRAALAAGFRVYVIGIGPSVGNLDNFAKAGGTDHFFPATSATDLADALASISKVVSSCTFSMPHAPPDANNVAVYLDGKLFGPGHTSSVLAKSSTLSCLSWVSLCWECRPTKAPKS